MSVLCEHRHVCKGNYSPEAKIHRDHDRIYSPERKDLEIELIPLKRIQNDTCKIDSHELIKASRAIQGSENYSTD